jgi:hypothetical protein
MGIKLETKTDKEMSKADITIPLGIPDVRVLQTTLNERGKLLLQLKAQKAEHDAANVGNGSQSYTEEMNG